MGEKYIIYRTPTNGEKYIEIYRTPTNQKLDTHKLRQQKRRLCWRKGVGVLFVSIGVLFVCYLSPLFVLAVCLVQTLTIRQATPISVKLRNKMIPETSMPITRWDSRSRLVAILTLVTALVLSGRPLIGADAPWSSFMATTLSGEKINSEKLLGQPTLLIVTPSRNAAESTRE